MNLPFKIDIHTGQLNNNDEIFEIITKGKNNDD